MPNNRYFNIKDAVSSRICFICSFSINIITSTLYVTFTTCLPASFRHALKWTVAKFLNQGTKTLLHVPYTSHTIYVSSQHFCVSSTLILISQVHKIKYRNRHNDYVDNTSYITPLHYRYTLDLCDFSFRIFIYVRCDS
jgi:hypothetical protein